ncbi:MAG TPA: hypothetical protein DCY93_00955 [Firmicutes bacterium]|nr:hypothetical protein [Bacillota bacterium]
MISKGENNIFLPELECDLSEKYDVNDSLLIEALVKGKDKRNIEWNFNLRKNASLNIVLFDLASHESNIKIFVDAEEDTEANIYIASSTINDKKIFNVEVINKGRNGHSKVKMYGVNKGSGTMKFLGATTIEFGAKKSDVRQDGRIINFSSSSNSEVSPKLFIKENDVKASHGAVVGSVPNSSLFYLMSRGISRKDAIDLLARGSFLTFVDLLSSEKVTEAVKKELNYD